MSNDYGGGLSCCLGQVRGVTIRPWGQPYTGQDFKTNSVLRSAYFPTPSSLFFVLPRYQLTVTVSVLWLTWALELREIDISTPIL